MRILVAEDNSRLLKTLTRILESEGFTVDGVSDGLQALDYAHSCEYDGIVLDIMMPGKNGLEVLQQLRGEGLTCPTMFLTALGDVPQRVQGLEAGADDYLPKPFAVSEFVARVHAMMRRRATFAPQVISFAGANLNCSSHKLTYGQKEILLSNKEFQILELLMLQPNTIVSISNLLDHAWNWDSHVDSSAVWVQVSNLRKKIAESEAPLTITFKRGSGYILEQQ